MDDAFCPYSGIGATGVHATSDAGYKDRGKQSLDPKHIVSDSEPICLFFSASWTLTGRSGWRGRDNWSIGSIGSIGRLWIVLRHY